MTALEMAGFSVSLLSFSEPLHPLDLTSYDILSFLDEYTSAPGSSLFSFLSLFSLTHNLFTMSSSYFLLSLAWTTGTNLVDKFLPDEIIDENIFTLNRQVIQGLSLSPFSVFFSHSLFAYIYNHYIVITFLMIFIVIIQFLLFIR